MPKSKFNYLGGRSKGPKNNSVVLLGQSNIKNKTVSVACSCGGENERCFRCYGAGQYDSPAATQPISSPRLSSTISETTVANFARDARGAGYTLRERERFDSSPVHDCFDDESSS